MTQRGVLTVVSGFSGVGKGTIMKRLLEKYDNYVLSVSATTRAPRIGEQEGREYFFHTDEEFQEMIRQDELAEYACYCGHYYGTPKKFLMEQMSRGRDVILEIEIQGALNIKKAFPDAILLFIMPPNAQTLYQRLVGRGSEEEEVIEERLKRATEEAEGIEEYDYVLVNDVLETCVDELHELIRSQHHSVSGNLDFINKIKKEVNDFSKGDK